MQKQRLIIIIGVILGLIAVFLIKVFLDQQRRAIEEREKAKAKQMQQNLVAVLVAKKDIAKDAEIDAASIGVDMVPKENLQHQAATSFDRVSGMKALAKISKGEQISLSKLSVVQAEPGSRGYRSLASSTPVGKRAVTIVVDSVAGLAGMIKPGDYVDVLSVIPIPITTPDNKQVVQPTIIPLFQNVLVLAVGREVAGVSSEPAEEMGRYSLPEKQQQQQQQGSSSVITLSLGSQEANILAFVQEQGKFKLVLRSPADAQVQPSQPTTWDTLFKYVMPGAAQSKEPVVEQPKPKEVEYIEVYRGLNKEKFPLSE